MSITNLLPQTLAPSQWFDGATAPPPSSYKRLLVKLSGIRRDYQNQALAQRFPRQRTEPWPEQGYSLFGVTDRHNGLSRAYRYEIERLREEGSINPRSRNVILLAQPKQLRKLLTNPPPNFAETWRIGLWVTEFDQPQAEWDFAFDLINEIWTPSEFSARAFRKATHLPITIVPHAVKISHGAPMDREKFGILDSAFLGMAIMDVGACPDRKNPIAHIRTWQRAFGNDANAQLIIKARFSKHKPFVRDAMKAAIGNSKNIQIIEAEFSDAEMESFQRMANAYLSLHRAEGYGLNIHQMLELGIPTVATAWSGNMDYMLRYPHAFAVPYRLIPYQDPTLYYRGDHLKWAEADIEAAANIVASLFSQRRMTSIKRNMK